MRRLHITFAIPRFLDRGLPRDGSPAPLALDESHHADARTLPVALCGPAGQHYQDAAVRFHFGAHAFHAFQPI
jgi:hypothetical protein